MSMKNITRRDLLKGTAVAGAGLVLGNSVPALGEDKKPDAPLPIGSAGKLTVIHRTEYFEEAQTIFRDLDRVDRRTVKSVIRELSGGNPQHLGSPF